MELLAPAGSKESCIAAIRAGADAVYMGVPGFNARASAQHLSLYDLQVLIDHAHRYDVKVFLALNTLVKHEEINDAVRLIDRVSGMSADALIVQDLGIAGILRKYYPDIELHASTQMAVHNRMGVNVLAEMGFKRAIMARELSFPELKMIAAGAPIGIEIFCHGALCVSMSGLCLFSSFVGGLSGNRGRCTQPCRRRWDNGDRGGYLFSPRDQELAAYIGKFKEIGITSLKIEGRMRSSDYVFRTVRAYRMLLDASADDFKRTLAEAQQLLAGDMARAKTTCLYFGRDNDMFQPAGAQCLGQQVGTVVEAAPGRVTIAAGELHDGERLRLANPLTDTTVSLKVKDAALTGTHWVIPFERATEFAPGNPVFRTEAPDDLSKDIEKEIDGIFRDYKAAHREGGPRQQFSQTYTSLISNAWRETKKTAPLKAAGDTLWVRFDAPAWLDVLPALHKNLRYVFSLTKDNLYAAQRLPRDIAASMTVELPPFIAQRELPVFKQCVDQLASAGIDRWVVNNIAHYGLFDGMNGELTAGHFLYTWNAYTAAFLSGLGAAYFTASWEDDYMNIRKMCGPGLGKRLVVYLYGRPAVIRSRLIAREMLSVAAVSDRRSGASFLPVFESGLALLVPEMPVCNFTAREKLRECGISNFGIDLSFAKPDAAQWDRVLTAYHAGANVPGSDRFNFKRGVK